MDEFPHLFILSQIAIFHIFCQQTALDSDTQICESPHQIETDGEKNMFSCRETRMNQISFLKWKRWKGKRLKIE